MPSVDMKVKFYADRPSGTPLWGSLTLNARGKAEYSDLGLIEGYLGNSAR